jgi:hypothetical protein
MAIKRILTIGTGKGTAKRPYATDIKGQVMFPKDKSMVLEVGQYANVIEEEQTQTFDDAGNLVPLVPAVKRQIITAVFKSRQDAIAAAAEDGIFEQETKLFAAAESVKLKTTYKLEGVDLSALGV